MDDKIFVTRSSMPEYETYVAAIKPLWESHWLTNMGTYHKQLEEELKEYLDVPELSLMVNGHMALELAIQSFGFPEGAEVITTPFTFISTTHAIVRNRLKPVFCDVKRSDGTMDETRIEDLITEKTVAILPVHVYGNVCNVEEIQKIAYQYGLKVIYDAAHCFGVKYGGRGIGAYGDASVFSFHATKVFNTIEGGAVCFSNHDVYEKLYNLKNFGIRGEELVTDVGANAKMNEFCAIMGLCNLKRTAEAFEKRKAAMEYYREGLREVRGITFPEGNPEATKNYAYMAVVVEDEYGISRDELYLRLREANVFSRKYFYPLTSDQACFKNKYRKMDLRVARDMANRVLVLPLYEDIPFEAMDRVVGVIKRAQQQKGDTAVSIG